MSEYLFPVRMNRRDLLRMAGAAGLACAASIPASAQGEAKPVRIGQGQWTFTLDEEWGRLPQGQTYGFGCAIVVDGRDRVIVTSRSQNPCVAIFDRDGKLIETWSKDFADKIGYTPATTAGTAHGLYWSKEGRDEFLYFTENRAGNNGARVYKTDMTGRILYQLGNVAAESSSSQRFNFTNPTDVAVAPNGDIFIVDGYGSQLVYKFDKDFKHIKTIGGPGNDHGKFRTCHGVWISTLKPEPEVYIADRANNRLEVFSLDLDYKRTIGDVRTPCCFYQHNGHLYVPELGARVTVLDAQDRIVARLGDGQGTPAAQIQQHPEKFATPHALTLDSRGNLYVVEWLPFGRPRKFRHTPA